MSQEIPCGSVDFCKRKLEIVLTSSSLVIGIVSGSTIWRRHGIVVCIDLPVFPNLGVGQVGSGPLGKVLLDSVFNFS
ncbi:282_t:CDS:2 [Gigaspora margarita]|uniref:282_t:CDS:1 n=1 Tax=Gigaspora margarita TaxID=4874 RepID=A0ABN7VAZ5_GIGMA|nr:282_t:CDS:2 [Gigaspora margarita]